MKLLTFQANRFGWTPHSRTLEEAPGAAEESGAAEATEVMDAVVVFFHTERKDMLPEERKRVFRHTLKHVKWLANKRGFRNVVLHSFTHLGAESADPDFALELAEELAERLRATEYRVWLTPFGWFSAWNLDVLGDSLAKVWKEI